MQNFFLNPVKFYNRAISKLETRLKMTNVACFTIVVCSAALFKYDLVVVTIELLPDNLLQTFGAV
jgi:hypothetical protein